MNDNKPGIEDAISAAGSQEALAKLCGCTQQVVSSWKRRGYVPVLRAVEVEQATGVSRTRLINPKVLEVLDVSGV